MTDIMDQIHHDAASIMHNCRCKHYPDGTADILVASADIFREPGWELADKWAPAERDISRSAASDKTDSLMRAKRRARVAVYDLAMCNDFAYFVTLTLDKERVDRYDSGAIIRKLNHWTDNHVRRDGLCYVLIPEYHKDGAVHFHGFVNAALAMVDSGHKDKDGHTVFNCPAWTLGFSTAIRLYGERRSAIGYVCKYITKAQDKIGGRWYYSGGGLRKPEVSYGDVEYSEYAEVSDGYTFKLDALSARVVKLTVGGDERDTFAAAE